MTTEPHEGQITRRRRFAQLPDALIIDKRLSSHAVRVWARLDKYAGEDGRAFPSRDVLATDLGLSLDVIKRAFGELTSTGWITRTRRAVYANVWDTELNDIPAENARSAPDGAPVRHPGRAVHWCTTGRCTCAPPDGAPVHRLKKETQQKETQQNAGGSVSPLFDISGDSTSDSPHDHFPAFWALYPRKDAKKTARAAWDRAIKTANPGTIVEALKRYCESDNVRRGFIALPATWLNQERWNDEGIDAAAVVGRSTSIPDGW